MPLFLRCFLVVGVFLGASLGSFAADPAPVDVVIYGATPGGIATAVRAAREGLQVVLVHHHRHIGGMPTNGLGVWDTLYDGVRAPIFREVRSAVASRYPERAPGSPLYLKYEPHVAEEVFEALVKAENRITVVREFYPAAAKVLGTKMEAVTFQAMGSNERRTFAAAAFVDASYEGDLAKVAGAKMIVGRESRAEYGESHAGKVFTALAPVRQPLVYQLEGLNLREFPVMANVLLPGSTGEADRAVQAYNFRVCWTKDPANRRPVTKPARYEREIFFDLKSRWTFTNPSPNQKTSWNAPLLTGRNFDYPDGDWKTRDEITARHRDLALGMLWFLQNDPEVPKAVQEEARNWGLPKDEFADNGGFPWEMYAREARRLEGRNVFTQHDGMAAPGFGRAPVHEDAIAITEWSLDSHTCTSEEEGKVLLSEETRPGQISYQCLLPKELDNLLVTGCVSSSHIGWGTIRLEPTWMHLGESAAYALVQAKRDGVLPAAIAVDRLQRTLVAKDIMLSFFNDFDMSAPTVEQRAAQYLGTRGYFASYNARLDLPLTPAIAAVWAKPSALPNEMARRVATAEGAAGTVTGADLAKLAGKSWTNAPADPITRGQACLWLMNEGAKK